MKRYSLNNVPRWRGWREATEVEMKDHIENCSPEFLTVLAIVLLIINLVIMGFVWG